jgi:hypothetical protein
MRFLLAFALSSALLFGCGDGSQLTTLTVESAPDLRSGAPLTFEYTATCRDNPSAGDPEFMGELEAVGPGAVNGEPGSLWSASIDAPPGRPCAVQLVMRDVTGEVICTHIEMFIVAANGPTEVDIFLGCGIF